VEFSLIFLRFLMPLFAGNYKTKEFRVSLSLSLSLSLWLQKGEFLFNKACEGAQSNIPHANTFAAPFLILKSHSVQPIKYGALG
jgi:hypothetical protein